MKIYATSIEIAAAREQVWNVLTQDLPCDPNPFGILRFEGKVALDQKIKLWSEVSPKQAFRLKVSQFQNPQTMVWTGGMPLGLFVGRRTFRLLTIDTGTRFEMQETFSGLMAGLITKSIPDLGPSFEKFAKTLKEKAENK